MNDIACAESKPKSYTVSQSLQEKAMIGGNLADLTPSERLNYYGAICESLGLNPLTRPFEYITLNGKLTLYARKDCTEQLRSLRELSIKIVSRELMEGVFIVTAQATNAKGRSDESIGAVPVSNLQGEQKANAMMKAETKAKRRVTLSFCGLGILDESEIDSIPGAKVESSPVPPAPRAQDKGATVLGKMKRNGTGHTPEQDGAEDVAHKAASFAAQQDRDAAPPSMPEEDDDLFKQAVADYCGQFRTVETAAQCNDLYRNAPANLKQAIYDTYSKAISSFNKKK